MRIKQYRRRFSVLLAGVLNSSGSAPPVVTFGSLRPTSIGTMGDSITEGANASTAANRWVNLLATLMGGAALLNKGLSGTVVQNSNDAGGAPRANNMVDRFLTDLAGINKRQALAIAGGFNDARYTAAPSTFNVTQYGVSYRRMLNKAFEAGYTPDAMLTLTPYWISDLGLTSGSGGFTGQSRAGFEAFVDAQRAIALEYNTFQGDTYVAMRDGGGSTLIDPGDNIHPLDNGHVVIRNTGAAATRNNPNAAPGLSLASPAPGTVNWTLTPVAGATSYTVEYMPAGGGTSWDFVGTVTGDSLTGQFTGITPNFVTVRARANFAGGSSGWIPSQVRAANELQGSVNFTAAAGTGLASIPVAVGSGFVVQTGYASGTEPATDGTALYATAAASVYRSTTPLIGANFYVEGTLVFRSALTNDTVGIATNMSASANSFYFLAYFRTDNTLRLYRNNNGSNTVVATWPMTFASGSRVLRLTHTVMEGFLRLTPTLDGAPLTSPAYYDDTAPLPLGSYGFRFGVAQTSTTGVHLQDINLRVQAL